MPKNNEPDESYIDFSFGSCARCGKELPNVKVPTRGYELWSKGMDIATACPTLTREQTYIVTHRVCPDCQRKGMV